MIGDRGFECRWWTSLAALFVALPLWGIQPLSQLPGTAGCVSETGTGGACVLGKALDGALSVAVSPDGLNVYVASLTGASIAVFDRDPLTGELTIKAGQDGCVSESGSSLACEDGRALLQAASVAVSPDGTSVYVASRQSDAVAVFDRDVTTGAIDQKAGIAGCVSEDGTGGACDIGVGLNGATSVVVSADGRSIYVASFDGDAVASFERDPATGELNQIDCISEDGTGGDCVNGKALDDAFSVAVSLDGRSVYAASSVSSAVAVFVRNVATGALTQPADATGCISDDGTSGDCTDGESLGGAFATALSDDGRNLYVTARGSNALAIFDRDPATGLLTQKGGTDGCIDTTGSVCSLATLLGDPFSVTVSRDGESVYVAASLDDAVVVFDRKLSGGQLIQKTGPAGCVSETGGSCADGKALDGVAVIAVSPDSRSVYAASFQSDAVAIFDRDVPSYDIDGDGEIEPLTDGLLLLRYMFGFTGATLVNGAVDLVSCTRCTAAEISAYIESLSGP